MFRTLRSRLILSHILPFLIIIPLIGITLIYFIEKQFLLPQLSVELGVDARLLTQMLRYQPELFQDPATASLILQSYQESSDAEIMFLDSEGYPIVTQNLQPGSSAIQYLAPIDQIQIQNGQIITKINPEILTPVNQIEVLAPVMSRDQQILGIVRMTYDFETVVERFSSLRTWILGVILLGLIVGVILGSTLAVTISRPIQQVTAAVNRVALGSFDERLPVKDPQEIQMLAQAVNYLVDRLQNLEMARQKLLANLVHELGRPLGALRTAIQALRQGATQDMQLTSDLLAGMDEETARLKRLLDDLNRLYDQTLGTLELDRKSLYLTEWLPQVISPWQEAAQAKGISWENDLITGDRTIQADPIRLGQAIGNLASNAIKFTPTGGRVNFSVTIVDDEVWMAMSDSGPGVLFEDQENIFRPFYQGETGKRIKEGMGLGLSIAREIVQAHGGIILLSSEVGTGARFTIILPVENPRNPA